MLPNVDAATATEEGAGGGGSEGAQEEKGDEENQEGLHLLLSVPRVKLTGRGIYRRKGKERSFSFSSFSDKTPKPEKVHKKVLLFLLRFSLLLFSVFRVSCNQRHLVFLVFVSVCLSRYFCTMVCMYTG